MAASPFHSAALGFAALDRHASTTHDTIGGTRAPQWVLTRMLHPVPPPPSAGRQGVRVIQIVVTLKLRPLLPLLGYLSYFYPGQLMFSF